MKAKILTLLVAALSLLGDMLELAFWQVAPRLGAVTFVTKNMVIGAGGLTAAAVPGRPTVTTEGMMRQYYAEYFWDSNVPFGPTLLASGASGKVSRNMNAADIAQLFYVPAGTYILLAMIEEIKAEGAALTVGLGDASGANVLINAFNANQALNANLTPPIMASSVATLSVAAGNLASSSTVQLEGIQGGKMYTADDYIILTFNNGSVATQLRVTVYGMYIRGLSVAALGFG